jgi:O-antigen ligase
MTRQLESFSRDQWGAGSAIVGVLLVVAAAFLVYFTRRIELGAIVAMPVAFLLLTNFRLATTVTVWVTLIWVLRLPLVFFEFLQFSYLVYLSLALTMGAYLLRLGTSGKAHLPVITNKWVWLLIPTIVLGGIHGARSIDSIPVWLLTSTDADLGVTWTYYRTVVFPGVLLPLLAILIGGALCDRQELKAFSAPIWTLVCVINFLIIGQVVTSAEAFSILATQRSEHLITLGFHSNEFGTFLAIAYALGLGMWMGVEGSQRKAFGALLATTAVALLLTFSRGAYLAFAVTNIVVFMRAAPKKRAAFLLVAALLWLVAPAAMADRIGYGLASRDANEISAGRIDNLWLPLLPDIAKHLWFGQGMHSIMWTDAQRFQEIFPVTLAHNAFLDLVLDFGLIGGIPMIAWYLYLWRGFRRGAKSDPDPKFRALFVGGSLALMAFLLSSLTNNRLTPTATSCVLWIVAGVLLGRSRLTNEFQTGREVNSQPVTFRRPLVGAVTTSGQVVAVDGV